jgi:hypothetical protein
MLVGVAQIRPELRESKGSWSDAEASLEAPAEAGREDLVMAEINTAVEQPRQFIVR